MSELADNFQQFQLAQLDQPTSSLHQQASSTLLPNAHSNGPWAPETAFLAPIPLAVDCHPGHLSVMKLKQDCSSFEDDWLKGVDIATPHAMSSEDTIESFLSDLGLNLSEVGTCTPAGST